MTSKDKKSPFAKLPPVDRLLLDPAAAELIELHGRQPATQAIRAAIERERELLRLNPDREVDRRQLLQRAATDLHERRRPSLTPVYNLTGTVLHTNLGRAVLPREALDAVMTAASSASNLEYDLSSGKRGDRDAHIEDQIRRITGAEAATVVNNNAAAVMLVLNSLGKGKAVAVSRGELVEIGGSFRIPDIMAGSGCRLVEVGTTNRTHLKDFEAALADGAEMIMKVHTSNYVIEGFTASVVETELANLARRHGVPFVNDLGSGTLVDLERYGLPHEPTPMEALASGADVVTFSGDKLLGGPQAGIIVGSREMLVRFKNNPMKRALRCDKMTIAALSAVLDLYADPDRLTERLPTLRWLTRQPDEIAMVAIPVAEALRLSLPEGVRVEIVDCASQIGSGALPTRTVASTAVAIGKSNQDGKPAGGHWLEAVAASFRKLPVPVIGRIHDGRFILDMRCLEDAPGFIAQLDRLEVAP